MPFHKMLKNRITSPCHFLTSPLSHSGLKPWKCLLWLFLFRIVSAWKSPCFANSLSWSGRTIWDFWRDGGAKSSSVLALILTLIQFLTAFSFQFMASMLFSPAHLWLLPQWLYLAVQVSQASISVRVCRALSVKAQFEAAICFKAILYQSPQTPLAADTTLPTLLSSPSQSGLFESWELQLLPEQRVSKQTGLLGLRTGGFL